MLDPQTQALLNLIAEKGVPPTHLLSPSEARKMYLERRFFSQPPAPELAAVSDIHIPSELSQSSIKARTYRPLGSKPGDVLAALIYFHGGGCVIGDLDTHDVLCREFANLANIEVISIDYRLAPENPFPAALEDCLIASNWIHAHANELNINPKKIALGGDSAGGYLTATTSLLLRDAKKWLPAFQLLIYPMTDAHASSKSIATNGQGYLLTKDAIDYYYGHYLPNPDMKDDWRASPIDAPNLEGLPPALVITAGFDPLRDEGLAYANRLSSAKVKTQYICFERQIHGFILMGRILDEANTAVKLCAQALKDQLKT